ncbi:macrolide family glycosyltransferase [Anaerocolumna xylanovorans]|uniref:Glycosyltransferase, MGT family n=1 Tax=Anaerocolumna xylanovorans DSM 12503 TaxID=1121345 RepID=A0A1M7YIJ6_9FIRM|nr:macrolide family glycosyltransferase [Anaerocolumna xylanovorans]SHO52430.1 glycosyltransferase, MGT family [Anaerocolumna xylanovorans DSM 12503]
MEIKEQKLKILMINLPFSGHTNPTLGLAKELVNQGCQVTYIQAPEWRERVILTGAGFVAYDDYPDTLSPTQKEIKSWRAAYNTALRIGSDYDCIIYEILFFVGKSLADKLQKPSVRLFSTFALNQNILNMFAKTGGLYMTSIFRFRLLYRLLSQVICKKFDLRTNDIIDEIVSNLPELNYVYTVKEFQILNKEFPDTNYKFIGPSISHRNSNVHIAFDEIRNPLIYISLGTLLNDSISFYKKCFEAFACENVTVILSVGQNIPLKKLGQIPENFRVYSFVPQLEVLQHTSLFITHGGMNSVNEAIYYGVPMLVVPVGNDQPTVANRVNELGLGKRLNRKKLSSENLRCTAFDVMNDVKVKKTVQIFQQAMSEAGGNSFAAHEIIDYVRNQNF